MFIGITLLLLKVIIDTAYKVNNYDGWTLIGQLQQIYIYPSEGNQIFRPNNATCTKFGLQCDSSEKLHSSANRLWVTYTIDPSGVAKEVLSLAPVFATIQSKVTDNELILQLNNTTFIKSNLSGLEQTPITVVTTKGDQKIHVYDCGDKIANVVTTLFFSNGKLLRLGVRARSSINVDEENEENKPPKVFKYYRIINENSVEALRNLSGKWFLTHNDFGPNIVITRNDSYWEKNISSLKIGEAEFHDVQSYDFNSKIDNQDETNNFEVTSNCISPRKFKKVQNIGMSLKVLKTGKIFIGSNVYAKYHQLKLT